LICSGCSSSEDALQQRYDDYLTRLSRVLAVDVPAASRAAAVVPPPPTRRALRTDTTATSISLWEFLNLRECDLGALVGYRNSGLGKVLAPSQRLVYEGELLALANRCVARDAAAAHAIGRIVDIKRAELPRHFANAVFAGPEMQAWLGGAGPGAAGSGYAITELADLAGDLGTPAFSAQRLEQALHSLSAGTVGRSRREWATHRDGLVRATVMLKAAAGDICRQGRPTPAARYARNVLLEVFAPELGATVARTYAKDLVWVSAMTELIRRAPFVPTPFEQWLDNTASPTPGSEWSLFGRAIRDHATTWSAVLAQCQLAPVAP
jgi:hypothetical protein